jgi:hypothetical protein
MNDAAKNGWGKDYYDIDSILTRQFRENLLKMAGAKAYSLIRIFEQQKDSVTVKQSYINLAKKYGEIYNNRYLKVETEFVRRSTAVAHDFVEYMKDVDIYPYLKNRTMADDRVSKSHRANDGVIKPVNEWTVLPPYRPNCRCWLEQTTDEPTGELKYINTKWANNPVLTKEIFLENTKKRRREENKYPELKGKIYHSYFAGIEEADIEAVRVNTELMKEYMPYNNSIKVGDNTVYISDFTDLKDLPANMNIAKILAKEMKRDIYIRPHFSGTVANKKAPELGIGKPNILGDLKSYQKNSTPKNFFSNTIKKASKQGCKCVVIDLELYNDNVSKLKRFIKGGLNDSNENIENLIFVKNNKVIQLSRKQVLNTELDNLSLLNVRSND